MGTYILLGLLIVLFVVPFTYIIVVDIIEIIKRINEIFQLRVRPVTISLVINLFS